MTTDEKLNHGIDCECLECAKTRDFLYQLELSGKITFVGTEEDKKKLRR